MRRRRGKRRGTLGRWRKAGRRKVRLRERLAREQAGEREKFRTAPRTHDAMIVQRLRAWCLVRCLEPATVAIVNKAPLPASALEPGQADGAEG